MPEIRNTPSDGSSNGPAHFKGKDALHHVIEAQAAGIVSASEVHGTEIPGHLSAMGDAARETAILLSCLWLLLIHLNISLLEQLSLLSIFSVGWFLWKAGRAAWLGWFRLERLHRVLDQERYEIEHHFQQERDELRILYAAKGFEGKLLEDVLDVLMADNERLLKVMVEEELGLSLETTEHPLKQGLGAALGVLVAAVFNLCFLFFWPEFGLLLSAALAVGAASAVSAYLAQNQPIPAIIWNLGLATLVVGTLHFLLRWHQYGMHS